MGLKHFRRILCLATGFWVLTWGVPDLMFSAEPKPGDVIDASNVDSFNEYLPFFMIGMVKDGWQFVDPVVIHVTDTTENLPPKAYMEATQKNGGKTHLNEDGTVSGYETGFPFPDPQEPNKALKIMWNLYYRWRADDFHYPSGFITNTQRFGGTVSTGETLITQVYYTHRTVVDPKPNLENPNNLHFAMTLNSRTPPNKDMITLTWRYEEPTRHDDMWTYIPPLRRTLRMVSSERGNPVRGTPFTWDDFYGFDGKILMFQYELTGEQRVLGLFNQKTLAVGKYNRGYPHPVISGRDDPFEMREVFMVDAVSLDPRYAESKKTIFVPKDHFYPIYTQSYDKQGNFWKAMCNGFMKAETAQGDTGCWLTQSSTTDFKTKYWTQNIQRDLCLNCDIDVDQFDPAIMGVGF
ncbi:MAG: DUF1329 domain-containing protein [Desulfobacterales bacterium]